MIAIVNVQDVPQPRGAHLYEIRINHEVITTFYHNREESLAVCLRRAAEAAEKWEFERVRRILETQ